MTSRDRSSLARTPQVCLRGLRSPALWLWVAASIMPSWAAGCRDLKADPGYCATCPADPSGAQTRDGQAVSTTPEQPAGAGASASNIETGASGHGGAGEPNAAGAPSNAGTLGAAANGGMSGTVVNAGRSGTASPTGGAGSPAGSAGSAGMRPPLAGAKAPPKAGAGGVGGSGTGACGLTCPASAPLCDPSTLTCVRCYEGNTTACEPAKPACDVSTHTCVLCTAQDEGACTGDKLACDGANYDCVECTGESHKACSGETPLCNESKKQCVQCLGKAGDACPAELPACDVAKNACVACLQSADCGMPMRARCDTGNHVCGACVADGDCQHFPAAPVCDLGSGSCVACTPQSEPLRCPGTTCIASSHTCGNTPIGSLQACFSCQSDHECAPGLACVAENVGGRSVGNFCFASRGSAHCSGVAAMDRPYSRVVDARSVDGVQGSYCQPNVACPSVLDALPGKACSMQGPSDQTRCGATNEGLCAAGKCTYRCQAEIDCPLGEQCPMGVCE